jgi:hypothetical protein
MPPIIRLALLFLPFLAPFLGCEQSALGVGSAPPEPMDMHIKVHREGKTEIPLRIYGRANEPLKFSIRVPPVHGKLTEPRQTEREVSVVVYEPPADLSITADKFYYTVQSSAGVSGAVQVAITIVDDPPKLAITDSIEFGKVRAGARNYRMLEISNHGGLIATGQVIVDAPWRIEGKNEYHLAAGEIAVFKIFFEPVDGREYEGVARYTSDRLHSTTLHGVADAAVAADPPEWVLQQTPGETERGGTFTLSSQVDVQTTLTLTADPRLKVRPAQVTLAPGGKAEVAVQAAPSEVGQWEAEIHLKARDYSITVPVQVPALSAVFRLVTPALGFGRIPTGKPVEMNYELENIGGTSGTVIWDISAPFKTPASSATLRAGERKSFPLQIEPNTAGRYRTWLQFTAGSQRFDLPVQAEVMPPVGFTARPSPGAGATAAPVETPEGSGVAGGAPAAKPNENVHRAIPADWYDQKPPKGVNVHSITPTTAVIEWPASLCPAKTFRAEMIKYSVEHDHLLHAVWLWDNEDPIERRGPNYALILKALTPRQPYTVRILPLDPDGKPGERLFAVDFFTPGKPALWARFPHVSAMRVMLLILAFLVGWRVWLWWKGRNYSQA